MMIKTSNWIWVKKVIPLTLKALKSNGEEKILLSLNDTKGFNLNKTIDISIRDYNPLQNEVLIEST